MEALAALHERGALRQLTFVVQSQVRVGWLGGAAGNSSDRQHPCVRYLHAQRRSRAS